MKFCPVLVFLAVITKGSSSLFNDWEMFKLEHEKVFDDESDEQFKYQVWLANKEFIDEHNKRYENGEVSYTMAMNEFSDLTDSEFKEMYTGLNDEDSDELGQEGEIVEPIGAIPASMDWRERGAVTPVKRQSPCGSCYAFSATGVIEGQLFRSSGKLVSLSEQQIMDCSHDFGSNGCHGGGSRTESLKYVKKAGGIQSESSYPYKGKDMKCRFNQKNAVAKVGGVKKIAPNEKNLLNAVAQYGPISVGIYASSSLKHYSGGVYDDVESCRNQKRNHAVLVVGYGNERGKDYWLVKNSWGPRWGLQGYVKMVRNKNNQCLIASDPVVPTDVKKVGLWERQPLISYFLSLTVNEY